MAMSRLSLSFLRRALNLQFLRAKQQEIRVTNIFYSVKVASKVNSSGLDLLITNLIQESRIDGVEINTVTVLKASENLIIGPFSCFSEQQKIRLPDDLFRQMKELLQLKARTKDIVPVIVCWNKNDNWFNIFVEKAKSCMSSMSSNELIGMIANLARSSSRPPQVNQLMLLAQSAAKLRLMDSRLRRIIAAETFANISGFIKWSQINAVVKAMAKLHIGHVPTWNAIAAWINNNRMLVLKFV
ncbi:hypothetical protein DINM_021145 [Dirofilaria immitis]|nr:hypothetical protein [Dirofilaria immitis]